MLATALRVPTSPATGAPMPATIKAGRAQSESITLLKPGADSAVAVAKEVTTIAGPTQSHDPDNPGSDVYQYDGWTTGTYQVWHFNFFAIYPTTVTYLIPHGSLPIGEFPVIAVSGGKFLDHPTAYVHLLHHLCRKGYVVLSVDTDTGPLDCQHSRMAGEFLEAVWKTIVKKIGGRTYSPARIAWWGHSMGAKVQAIAAQMTTNRYYIRPTAVIANHFSNNKGTFCNDDAISTASRIPTAIWYTIIKGDQDEIAGADPRKLYDALNPAQVFRQLLLVKSYSDDDLTGDHDAPLTDPPENPLVTLVGGPATLDALDWWLYWKIAVGAVDFHFRNKSKKWAYGTERENGGTDAAGNLLTHKVEAESAN